MRRIELDDTTETYIERLARESGQSVPDTLAAALVVYERVHWALSHGEGIHFLAEDGHSYTLRNKRDLNKGL